MRNHSLSTLNFSFADTFSWFIATMMTDENPVDGQRASGYDSDDATEVTSNTNSIGHSTCSVRKTKISRAGSSACSNTKNSGRWSTGDGTKRGNDTPISLLKAARAMCIRRCSGSTASTTHDDDNGDCDCEQEGFRNETNLTLSNHRPECIEDSNVANDFWEENALDLRSKPGVIHCPTDEMFSLPEEDDGVSAASPSQSNSTHSHNGSTPIALTEEQVRTYLKDYYEDFDSIFRHGKSSLPIWESFFQQYYTKDILWVRSSSNTLKGDELAHHFANDIEGIRMQLVSIDNIQLLGQSAVVVFTADQEFKYRGTPVSDRTVLTMVLYASMEEGLQRIRIAHEHRCAGKPIPKDTRWDSSDSMHDQAICVGKPIPKSTRRGN